MFRELEKRSQRSTLNVEMLYLYPTGLLDCRYGSKLQIILPTRPTHRHDNKSNTK